MTTPAELEDRLRPYVELVTAFVERAIPAVEFERRYADLYLNDQTLWPDETFAALDGLFADTDAFEPDPEVRAELAHTIDERTLHAAAERALLRLRNPAADG